MVATRQCHPSALVLLMWAHIPYIWQMLRASFPSSMALPVTDLSHKMGPQRMVRCHVVIQLVALFGARRVSLGASVISMDRALGEAAAKLKCSLANCGVLTGG